MFPISMNTAPDVIGFVLSCCADVAVSTDNTPSGDIFKFSPAFITPKVLSLATGIPVAPPGNLIPIAPIEKGPLTSFTDPMLIGLEFELTVTLTNSGDLKTTSFICIGALLTLIVPIDIEFDTVLTATLISAIGDITYYFDIKSL
ncbi:hypothetical protein SDC9_118492 [bioreactor metagenome]|uniref:Uncharacterized protein n=1 Tax=bioreactor metagenome TaxID=1076179 RepID=A0A645C2T4_9ZZZZ